jgi:hypothetical protein
MKILYIAHERRAAQAAAQALRKIAPSATLTWAQSPGDALGWIQGNRDARAVIVDADTQNQGCMAVLDQVRRLGLMTPVAVIAPEHVDGLLHALTTGLNAAVDREGNRLQTLEAQPKEVEESRQQAQPRFADRQAQHDATAARTTRISIALQELDAVLTKVDERHSAQTAAIEQLARRETELGAAVAEAVAARAAVEHRLADAETAHQHTQQRAAAELAAAAERQAAIENGLTRERTARATLEERLAASEIAWQDADRSRATELASLTTRLVDAEAQHHTSSARTNSICMALQDRILELEAATRTADERHAADTATADRLAVRETELGASLAEAITARTAAENRSAEAEAVYQDAQQRATADLAAGAERYAALEGRLRQEIDARTTLEQRLAAAETARQNAEQQQTTSGN